MISSFLLMAVDPTEYPIFRRTVFEKGYELTGYPDTPKGADSAGFVEHAYGFLDTMIKEANLRGLPLRDRLDAQGVLWAVVKSGLDWEPVKGWTSKDQHAFLAYRGEIEDDEEEEYEGAGAGKPDQGDPLGMLAAELYIDKGFLVKIGRLLEEKGQVIFDGPPGTGKTYVARKLAEHYADGRERVEIVQFHPSYAYEDFVAGYRPRPKGEPGFMLAAGPLKRIAERARGDPGRTFVLVIDEINRGNVAKVFG